MATHSETSETPDDLHLGITGMSCAACVRRVEKALLAVPGVATAEVDLVGHSAHVAGTASRALLGEALAAAGYPLVPTAEHTTGVNARVMALEAQEQAEAKSLARDLKLALVLAVPALVLGMSHGLLPAHPAFDWLQAALALAIVALPGRRFIVAAWHTTRARSADMNTLVALGVLSAVGYSLALLVLPVVGVHPHARPHLYFEAAAAIVLFVLVGKRLEARARRQLSAAVRGLVGLVPDKAQRIVPAVGEYDSPTEATTPVSDLTVGDLVRVRPGGRIPIDGEVVAGRASVDEAALTGESVPVERAVGTSVHAGTLVVTGSLDVRITATGDQTAVGRIMLAIESARRGKAPIARTADRVAAIFVPVVLALAVVTLVVHLALGATTGASIERFLTVLIIACPCALGLATPAAVAVGAGRAAELGVLVKGGATFEALARVDSVYLDKTGTLTTGAPSVAHLEAIAPFAVETVLAYAQAAEQHSEHPLGRAIVAHAPASRYVATDFQSEVGGGVRAVVDGHHVAVGAIAYISPEAAATLAPIAEALAARGLTPILVAIDDQPAGVIGLSDAPRPEAAAVMQSLRALGLEVIVLSGDRPAVVAALATTLQLSAAHGALRPDDKLAFLAAARASGKRVAMVGDGINDAPSLAAADVGIALQSGTDVAAQASDVVLTRGGLSQLPTAISLARKTLAVIHQNLFWAFAYNVVGIPLAAGVFGPLLGWELDPVYASLAMALSSVSVVLNALRLRSFGSGKIP